MNESRLTQRSDEYIRKNDTHKFIWKQNKHSPETS